MLTAADKPEKQVVDKKWQRMGTIDLRQRAG
jgi:hypothetical protein